LNAGADANLRLLNGNSPLVEEMQRLQMEYAANPGPENLAKMQSEMMRLQQEMITAAMQDAPAAMDLAFDDDEEEQKKFAEEHPPAPGILNPPIRLPTRPVSSSAIKNRLSRDIPFPLCRRL
jgi:ParB-like chromosome segregation protein Spo0J